MNYNVTGLEICCHKKTLDTIKLYWQYFQIIRLSQRDNIWNSLKYINWWSQEFQYVVIWLDLNIRVLYYDANSYTLSVGYLCLYCHSLWSLVFFFPFFFFVFGSSVFSFTMVIRYVLPILRPEPKSLNSIASVHLRELRYINFK